LDLPEEAVKLLLDILGKLHI